MAQKGVWNIPKKTMLEDGGALPKEDGNQLREYRAMHEENFLSSWLREDVAEVERLSEEDKQQESERGKRGVESEGERVQIKKECLDRVSGEVFEDFALSVWGEEEGSSKFSVCVLDVTFLYSNVNVDCGVVLSASECEFVEPQTLSLS